MPLLSNNNPLYFCMKCFSLFHQVFILTLCFQPFKRIFMTKQIIGLSVLLLISLCSTANAAVKTDAMAPATPPFSINIAGVYLQPSANNMTYAVYTTPLPLTTPNWEQLTIKPDHSTGLAIGLHYAFSDKNTINIDWCIQQGRI